MGRKKGSVAIPEAQRYQPCPACAKPVRLDKWADMGKPICCSWGCWKTYRRSLWPKKACAECGAEFQYRPHRTAVLCCSYPCLWKHLGRLHTGEANPFYGKKHSAETRAKIAQRDYRTGTEHHLFGVAPPVVGGRAGYREDLGHAVRSTWEANVCRWLRWLKRPYAYEPRRFPLTTSDGLPLTYVPDLLVEDTGLWIEVKGRQRYAQTYKVDLFRAQYPNERLLVIDDVFYDRLYRRYSGVIPGWECRSKRR